MKKYSEIYIILKKMLFNRILIIGANIITYEILAYIYEHCNIDNKKI